MSGVSIISLPSPSHVNHRRRRIAVAYCTTSKEREETERKVVMKEESRDWELKVAVRAVQMACSLCQRVQEELISNQELKISKDDLSPVTVADWAVQATISWVLSSTFGPETTSIMAEEDSKTLSNQNSTPLLNSVVNFVNNSLKDAPNYGLNPPEKPLNSPEILQLIQNCNSIGGPKGKFWVLDPVDGTLGFIRGDQYAIALALIENGEVMLGVLGCPNYPLKKEWLNYHQKYYRLMSRLAPPEPDTWHKGCVLFAKKGEGRAWMEPLIMRTGDLQLGDGTGDLQFGMEGSRRIEVSAVSDPALATVCEPVEKANSSHDFTAGLVHSVGLRKRPLRVYSMVKYAAIARGDAEIFMKFAKSGYREKIWDHAAGVVIIQEAGGVVTDARGRPLDFSKGIFLEGLDRGIIACSGTVLHERIINAVDASWDSSNL